MRAEELAKSRKRAFHTTLRLSEMKLFTHTVSSLPPRLLNVLEFIYIILQGPTVVKLKKKIQPACSIAAPVTFHPG